MPQICPRFSGIAKEEDKRLLLRLGCKQWQCPVCYKRNRELWRHHLMKKISEIGGAWSFWTVTMPKAMHKLSDEEKRCRMSLKSIRKNWDKFMKWMKREWGKFQYVRVFETHESGCLHIHFLASFHVADSDYKTANEGTPKQYTYSRKMKDNCVFYGWGIMNSVVNLPVDNFALTVGYATKYMTKEDDFVTKYLGKMRVRRIQTSQGIGAVPKSKSDDNWQIAHGVSIYENEEKPYFDLNKKRKVKKDDFGGEHWYPNSSELVDKKQI